MVLFLAGIVVLAMVAVLSPTYGGGPNTALSATTTLSILSSLVRVVSSGSESLREGRDGEVLSAGDRVRTDAAGRGLVTFFEGSALVLEPDTEFVVRQLQDGGASGTTRIGLDQRAGKFWARVARFAQPGSELRIDTPAATAVVRGTLVGGRLDPDGTFTCWALEGQVEVTAQGGTVVVGSDQQTVVAPGSPPSQPAARPGASAMLRVRALSPVFLRVIDPAGRTVGHAAPGVEVNQVLNAATGGPFDEPLFVDVPFPESGTYALGVEGRPPGGDFTVVVEAASRGAVFFQREVRGRIAAGERQVASLQLDLAARQVRLDGLQPSAAPLPGHVLLRPIEVTRVAATATAAAPGAPTAATPVPTLRLVPATDDQLPPGY